jgi:hypothetical protein
MNWSVAAFVLGGFVACINFYLSFVAVPLYRFRHGTAPARVPSGIPLIGSLLLAAAAFALPAGNAWQLAALALLALDTGGPHWFVAVQARDAIARRAR